jgi:hypothetical protein
MTWDPGVSATLGSRAYFGTTATDGTADTYAEIGHAQNITQFGAVYQIVKFVPIVSGSTEKFKGERDDGDIKISVGYDLADPGQAAAYAALTDTSVNYYNLKITGNDASAPGTSGSTPTTDYLKVKITAFTKTYGTVANVVMGEITAAVKTGSTVTVAAT